MKTTKSPILSGAVFCNSVSSGESGKLNCRGVFTSFLAWAYPTSVRSWHAILTLHNIPEDTTAITAAISFAKGKKVTLATVKIERGKEDIGNVINLPLQYMFKCEGLYTLHFNVVGTTITLRVPLKLTTQKWPRFTKRQIDFLKKNLSVPHSIRMNVLCSDCSRHFVFEESAFSDEELAGGVMPFPESGVIKCESCGHRLHLKDIQGQLRSSIQTAVMSAMRGR